MNDIHLGRFLGRMVSAKLKIWNVCYAWVLIAYGNVFSKNN